MGRFALAGALAGSLAGVVEAALLGFIPRAAGMIQPDVRYVIAFVAPLTDLVSGAIIGVTLGLVAALAGRRSPLATGVLAAVGIAIITAYVAWMLDWFGILPWRPGLTTPVVTFILVAVAGFCACLFFGIARRRFFSAEQPMPMRRWWAACGIIVAILFAGIAYYATHRPPHYPPVTPSGDGPRSANPNVVLIVLDTVRADHLSCYGYPRPTTPNLDRLAARGVRFENAIAPTSWTLPSLASIFTGLLPHQHGAEWTSALADGPWTLAKILRDKGYETAGFAANPFYGLSAWRLNEGFDVYVDDSYTIRHNLAVTFVGQSALHYAYDRIIRYNQFDHLTAAQVNRGVMQWYAHRDPGQPFFLFINFMDAHRPYLPPAPYDRRFGKMSRAVLATVTASLNDGRPPSPYTAQEQRELIDGYDNSLAYLDVQVGRLIDFLRRQPGGAQTYFIVTADHGEGFGEHGTYDHGWNLYKEVLHVPLIVTGPGVPAGTVVTRQVGTRSLFATVLDLALGLKGPIRRLSLRRTWQGSSTQASSPEETVSELTVLLPHRPLKSSLSLMTPQWHLIVNGNQKVELYNEVNDPHEHINVANEPALRGVLETLEESLESRIAYSVLPWRDLHYLDPLNRPGATFVEQVGANQLRLVPEGVPAGAAQTYFSHEAPSQLLRPNASERELLRTLPYH